MRFDKTNDISRSIHVGDDIEVNVETKVFDTRIYDNTFLFNNSDLLDPTLKANVKHLNGMDQGYRVYNRLGNNVMMRRISLDLTLQPKGDVSGPDGQQFRVALVYDNQPNATLGYPYYSDIWKDSFLGGSLFYDSFENPANKDRFEVLGRWEYFINKVNDTDLSIYNMVSNEWCNTKRIRKVIDLEHEARYTGILSNHPNDMTKGSIILVGFSNSDIGCYQLHGIVRIEFDDFLHYRYN